MPAGKIGCALAQFVETPHYVVRCYRPIFNCELFLFPLLKRGGGGGGVHTAYVKFVQQWDI